MVVEQEAEDQAKKLVEQFKKENPGLEEYVYPPLFLSEC